MTGVSDYLLITAGYMALGAIGFAVLAYALHLIAEWMRRRQRQRWRP
jgi:hypothetical protein